MPERKDKQTLYILPDVSFEAYHSKMGPPVERGSKTESIIELYCKKLKSGKVFLLEFLKRELRKRGVVKKSRLLQAANFDAVKIFKNYYFDNIQIPPSITLKDITSARFLGRKENLILYGAMGTGKSHLATTIGMEACNQGKKVSFFKTAVLANKLMEAEAQGELRQFLKMLENTDLLICDEWGYIPFEKKGAQLLFQVISDCYEKRSVIIITNLEFSRWNDIFYDEKMTAIIIDQLIQHSHLVVFTGSGYRQKSFKAGKMHGIFRRDFNFL